MSIANAIRRDAQFVGVTNELLERRMLQQADAVEAGPAASANRLEKLEELLFLSRLEASRIAERDIEECLGELSEIIVERRRRLRP